MSATNLKQQSLKIKGLLASAGLAPVAIARALKVDRRAVSQCTSINPKTGDFVLKNPYIREGIARYLNLSFKDLWGEAPCYPDSEIRKSPFFTQFSPENEHPSMRG